MTARSKVYSQTFVASASPERFNAGGRSRSITPPILEALRERLLEKPDLYLDEMVVFLWDESKVFTTTSSISRVLASIG